MAKPNDSTARPLDNTTSAEVGALPTGGAMLPAEGEKPKAKFVPKIIKQVTLPLIKPQIDEPVYIKVTKPMYVGKDVSAREKTPGAKKKEPATLIDCINIETGEEAQLIVPSVLKGIFEDEYPNGSYVGKGFQIVKKPKREGKDYFPFLVAEIEV
jgi:hypothetical protein